MISISWMYKYRGVIFSTVVSGYPSHKSSVNSICFIPGTTKNDFNLVVFGEAELISLSLTRVRDAKRVIQALSVNHQFG
jgi:hypothetical protein